MNDQGGWWGMPPQRRLCALGIVLISTASAGAAITPNVVPVDVGPLQMTGAQYVAYDLVVNVSGGDDWTGAVVTVSLTDAVVYQHPQADADPPDPSAFVLYPDAEVTSYYTSPGDYPNTTYVGGVISFTDGPTESDTSLSATWTDGVNTGDGTFVVARVTVLPDSPFWTGSVAATVYSNNVPGGVSDSWAISSDDYQSTITANYTGADPGTYNDPYNWDIEQVPVNLGLARFNVIIPGSRTISFDIAGASEIDGLVLGTDSTLSFLAGESLEVRGVSVLEGILNANGVGASFVAPSEFASFQGTRARAHVQNGGYIRVGAPTYTFDLGDHRADTTVMSADGADSVIDLSSLVTFSVPVDPAYSHDYTVSATNGGYIDLGAVTDVTGASTNCWAGCTWLQFLADAESDINFDALRTVSGKTKFNIGVPDYTLPLLEDAAGAHMLLAAANTMNLPALLAFDSGTITVPDGGTLNAPLLEAFTNSTITIADVGTLNAPSLEAFTNSTMAIADGGTVNAEALVDITSSFVELTSLRTLNAPPFTAIDHSRIHLSEQAELDVDATEFTFNWGDHRDDVTILSVDGVGTELDMSALTTLSVPVDPAYDHEYSVTATNGGYIDMSNLTTVTGASTDCWAGCTYLQFLIGADSYINLDSVETITGVTRLNIDIPEYALPSLISASSTHVDARDASVVNFPVLEEFNGHFDLGLDTTIAAPALASMSGSSNTFSIPTFAELDLPSLTTATGLTVNLDVGGVLSAPNLATFTSGYMPLSQVAQGGPFLDVPPFVNLDHSRILLDGGATFAVAATSYTLDWGDYRDHLEMLGADGAGTVLDLSTVESVRVPVNPAYSHNYSIKATNGGLVDLRHASTIVGASTDCWAGCTWLQFLVDGGGVIYLGDSDVTDETKLEAEGSTSRLDFYGGLTLHAPARLSLSLGAAMSMTGDFTFDHTIETDLSLEDGVVYLLGDEDQWLEVGGTDIGDPGGSLAPNFEIGQLVVGKPDEAHFVRLADNVDNGNRGAGDVEALYLPGGVISGGGLVIRGGSTLVLGNIPVYARVEDEWWRINDLIPPGENQVAFDQGFIALSVPVHDCNANGIDDDVDILLGTSDDCNDSGTPDECEIDAQSTAPGGPWFCTEDCDPDCNANGIPDACDIADETSFDCNENGIPDTCDVADGTSADVNENDVPDECEDCNENGSADFIDLANETSVDCNGNALPDECEIAEGSPAPGGPFFCEVDCDPDCNGNGIPDVCDIENCDGDAACDDCQPNGIPDACDIASGYDTDVNQNGIPDDCDTDCNENDVPDSQDMDDCDGSAWCGDCNGDHVLDVCNISEGDSQDGNSNGVPDECEQTPTAVGGGCRYINVTPATGPLPVAIRVAGDPEDARVACVDGYVQPDASIAETPVFQLPSAWGTLHVRDEQIVAGAAYTVAADFGTLQEPLLSLPVDVATHVWGDLTGDEAVNGFDLLALSEAYRSAAPLWTADLCGEVPDGSVNGDDLLCWIDAYRGLGYPFVTCGTGAIASMTSVPPASDSGAAITLQAESAETKPGKPVVVNVFLSHADDVRLFEVAMGVAGGRSGSLELTHVEIDEQRSDFIFSEATPVVLTDVAGWRATCALWQGGRSTGTQERYLATFVFVPSMDARGVFTLSLKGASATMLRDAANQPMGIDTRGATTIAIGKTRQSLRAVSPR